MDSLTSSRLRLMRTQRKKILAFIPVREGSKRIPYKNTRLFLGKPLLVYTIAHALRSREITRTIVCTESPEIAKLAVENGAEVPFLRPKKYAQDNSDVIHSLFYTLKRLKKEENYVPSKIVILQATSPLREVSDISDCFALMTAKGATTTLTVTRSHPKLYHIGNENRLILVNGSEKKTSITQKWKPGYILNGCTVYVVDTQALYKERRIITKNTRAVVMPKWRSIDIDEPEDWVMAEVIYKNRSFIGSRIKKLENEEN